MNREKNNANLLGIFTKAPDINVRHFTYPSFSDLPGDCSLSCDNEAGVPPSECTYSD